MPHGPALTLYDNAMSVPIQMGETGVAMGRRMANTVDNMMSGNPFQMLFSFLPNGQNTGRQSTTSQNAGLNPFAQVQGLANNAMGFANNLANQGTAAATNVMGQGMQAANGAMGFAGNMARQSVATATNAMAQGAQAAQDVFARTMQGFQGLVPRFG